MYKMSTTGVIGGHVWWANVVLLKNVLSGKINKKIPLGRPRTKYMGIVDDDMILID